MSYNTGNPIGSIDPRDAADNKENFDSFAISTSRTYTDRLGVERKTVTGTLQDYAAYNQRGVWATATAYNVNDVWRDGAAGAFYLVLTDYTSGATAAADISGGNVVVHQPKDWVVSVATISDLRSLEPAFDGQQVSVSENNLEGTFFYDPLSSAPDDSRDAIVTAGGKRWIRAVEKLRADLSDAESSVLIGGKQAKDVVIGSGYQSAKTLSPYVFDLHFSALKGCGQRDGEAAGQRDYTLSSSSSKGSFSVSLSSIAGIVIGSGLVFLGSDGEYYTNTVAGISGNNVALKQPLESDVSSGQNCWNLWNDEAHVTIRGYYAVADYMLRSTLQPSTEIIKTSDFLPLAGATVEKITGVNDVDFPGSFASETIRITTDSTPNQGARLTIKNVGVGDYEIPLQINAGGSTVIVSVSEVETGYTMFADTNVTKFDASTLQIKFRMFKPGDVRLNILCGEPAQINVSPARLLRIGGGRIDFKAAKLALYGDSWFAAGHIPARLSERLPETEIINLGIGGNSAQSLIDRFDSDLLPIKPDIVWVNTSTNDYFGGADDDLYIWRLGQVLSRVRQIGASSIVSTPTVGNVDTAPHRFDRSRYFYNNQTIFEQLPFIQQAGTFHVSSHDQQIAGPAGNSLGFAFLGFFRKKIIIRSHYFTNKVGVYAGANISSVSLITELSKNYNGSGVEIDLSGDKFVVLKAINESGSTEVVRGYAFIDKSTCSDA